MGELVSHFINQTSILFIFWILIVFFVVRMHSEIPVQRCPGNDGFLDIPLAEFLLSSGVLQALKNRGLYAKPCRHSEDSDGADPNCLVCNSTAPKYSTERTIYLKDL